VRRAALALGLLAALPARAAVYDEFEVHGTGIEAPGSTALDQHINYGLRGRTTPGFAGGLSDNRGVYLSTEIAHGVRPWWETAVYVPFAVQGGRIDPVGVKLRNLFVTPPRSDTGWTYGMLVELRYLTPAVSPGRYSAEIRPIAQWQGGRWTAIGTLGFGGVAGRNGGSALTPAASLYAQVSPRLALGLENYADLGPIERPLPFNSQAHQLFAVAEVPVRRFSLNLGLGYGLTPASDRLVAKIRIGLDF